MRARRTRGERRRGRGEGKWRMEEVKWKQGVEVEGKKEARRRFDTTTSTYVYRVCVGYLLLVRCIFFVFCFWCFASSLQKDYSHSYIMYKCSSLNPATLITLK